jgi:hypothetical protein
MEDPLKYFPLYSNAIYFIAGSYGILYSPYINTNDYRYNFAFFMLGLIIIITGIISWEYHKTTPSWFDNPDRVNNPTYKKWLSADIGSAVFSLLYGIFLLTIRIIHHQMVHKNVLTQITKDPNLYFSIIFILISAWCFFKASNYDHNANNNCKNDDDKKQELCFDRNIDSYDILHSLWHIFGGVSIIFWFHIIKNSFNWEKKIVQ